MISLKEYYVQYLTKLLSEQSPHDKETKEQNMLPSEIKKAELGKGAEYGAGKTKNMEKTKQINAKVGS